MEKIIEPNRVYNVTDAAKLIDINPQTMIEYCREGKIVCQKIGEWKILGQSILDFLGGVSPSTNPINTKQEEGISLTRKERLFLANQCQILEKLYPNQAESIAYQREAVEEGYELEYSSIAEHIYKDTLGRDGCIEVLDILNLFECLGRAYEPLKNKTTIKDYEVTFLGFDGNDTIEIKYLGYARHLRDGHRFENLKIKDLNSHIGMLDVYRRMLTEWRRSKNKYNLAEEDLNRIVAARTWR